MRETCMYMYMYRVEFMELHIPVSLFDTICTWVKMSPKYTLSLLSLTDLPLLMLAQVMITVTQQQQMILPTVIG